MLTSRCGIDFLLPVGIQMMTGFHSDQGLCDAGHRPQISVMGSRSAFAMCSSQFLTWRRPCSGLAVGGSLGWIPQKLYD